MKGPNFRDPGAVATTAGVPTDPKKIGNPNNTVGSRTATQKISVVATSLVMRVAVGPIVVDPMVTDPIVADLEDPLVTVGVADPTAVITDHLNIVDLSVTKGLLDVMDVSAITDMIIIVDRIILGFRQAVRIRILEVALWMDVEVCTLFSSCSALNGLL